MLDGLLGRGFAAKCKSFIKLTKSRIDVIRRKRRATEKFLKKDIADLLVNGLDINAYGRADGLLVELILSSCYDFVEGSCEFVLKHLSAMQKLCGCPEECREAVASLMFAAARFSDLPELRDLRQIFQERYGNSLECYVNQKFAANLNFKSSTLEKKVCLMQEIASEFSIKWDSKAFELRMSKSSASAQGHNTHKSSHLDDYDKPSHGKDSNTTGIKHNTLLKKSPDHPNVGNRYQNGKETLVVDRDGRDLQFRSTLPGDGIRLLNGVEFIQKKDGRDNPFAQGHNSCTTNHVNDYGKPSHGKDANTTGTKYDVTFEKSPGHPPKVGYKQNGKETVVLNGDGCDLQSITTILTGNGLRPANSIEVIQKRDVRDNPLTGRGATDKKSDRGSQKEDSILKPTWHSLQEKTVEQFEGGSKLHDSLGDTAQLREGHDPATARKSPSHIGLPLMSNVNEPFAVNREMPNLKPCYSKGIRPPYVKPKSKQLNSKVGASPVSSNIGSDGVSAYPSEHDNPNATSTLERARIGLDDSDLDWQVGRNDRLSTQSHEREFSIHEGANEVPVIKPKSTRRKHSTSRSRHNDGNNEDTGVRSKSRSRSRRRHESRRGLQTMFDDERYQIAEEERLMDKLLIHYSKKPSIIVPEKLRNPKKWHEHRMDKSAKETLHNEMHDVFDESEEMAAFPPRSVSLPREQRGAVKIKKVYTRAATFQPDRSSAAQHVHPKLPDYDDLAARIAALKGS